jgi:two-component system sensor histidine kinase PilS (NtrC family)
MAGAELFPDSFWRSLKQLNAFRFFLALFLIVSVVFSDRLNVLSPRYGGFLLLVGIAYLGSAILFRQLIAARRPRFGRQIVVQLVTDTVVIASFMHYGGGNETGLGLVLTVSMAAAGLHPRTRIMLFLASLATVAVLVQQSLWALFYSYDIAGGYFRAAMLSVGFFTVAGISHILAKGALSDAHVAREKEREAADLARINAKVIQYLPDGILVLGADGRVLQFNQQAERLLACRVSERSALSACHGSLTEVWQKWATEDGPDSAVLAAGEAGRSLRFRLLELEPDRREGALVIIEDISELEHQANQMKLGALGRLTANLAHEIRNPLSAINHAAQLLGEDAGGDPATGKLTRIIEDNVGRLNYLVEDVLSLSRRDRRDSEVIALAAFLTDFVQQFQHTEGIDAEIIQVDVAPAISVWFDRIHLHQILWNLCRNSCRHCSGQPGSVQLSAVVVDDEVRIEIYNDGPSIPADLRQRLFEPFYSTERAGTGLGLYIALELAQTNNGQLRCLEQSRGARFRLTAKMAKGSPQ